MEFALVLPFLVTVILGVLQLTQLQQASLLTQYAAYNAARAGIVWNGSVERMRDAALLSVLPATGRTDSLELLAGTADRQRAMDGAFLQLPWSPESPDAANGVPLRGLVRVDTLNPRHGPELEGLARRPGEGSWQELDFDGVGTRDDGVWASRDTALRAATVLTVRVRHWYEMRVPFANGVVFWAWRWVRTLRPERDDGVGYPVLTPSEGTVLDGLASGKLNVGGAPGRLRFFIPLVGTYSLRMQSNVYRKWVMH
ncbi:MAG TPA: TadE family protein [Myxococcaceae bacterium]|nr:TadE family protein [Myxococcaceae bacterium]